MASSSMADETSGLKAQGMSGLGIAWLIHDFFDHVQVHRLLLSELREALTSFGNPIFTPVDGNIENRGQFYLVHEWVGGDLQVDRAQLTLQSLFTMWKRPVHI